MLRKSIAIRMNTQGATLYTLWHSLAMQVSALMRQLSVHLVVQGVQIVSRVSPDFCKLAEDTSVMHVILVSSPVPIGLSDSELLCV